MTYPIAAERERQKTEEGWSESHDDSQSTGNIAFAAANIDIEGGLTAPGGNLSFTTYDISPAQAAAISASPSPKTPPGDPSRGKFTLVLAARFY